MKRFAWPIAATTLMALAAPAEGSPQSALDGPSFSKDIAPIILRSCSPCHRPGEAAPFTLLTYSDVKAHAQQIVAATRSRYMPPWKPEPGYGDFMGERRLQQVEIDLIERWVVAGAPEGNAADLPPQPQWTPGWQRGKPDLVVQMPEAYELAAGGPDVFRTFVIPLPVADVRYVKALDFRPGSGAVHHANLRVDATDSSRRLDEQDPGPGYGGGLIPFTATYPDGHFLGWTPGQLPPMSAATAWRLDRNTDLVVEAHLRPSGKPEPIRASIGLYFADRPPAVTPSIIRIGRQDIDIPAGVSRYVTRDSYVLPVDVDVYAVQPHAHYRAKEIKGIATLPDGSQKWLIYIKDWDFNWQDKYHYAKPLALPRGTTVAMEYTFDNSAENVRNPHHPPQHVMWGQQTSDEMGDLWLQVAARNDADRLRLNSEIGGKMMREDINGYESFLRANPGNLAAQDGLALLYYLTGNLERAVFYFEASARLQPRSGAAHYNLARALTEQGRVAEAIAEFQQTVAIEPGHAEAHNNLGALLEFVGRSDESAAEYRRALAIRPDYPFALNNLGALLFKRGSLDEAAQRLREALRLKADYVEAHTNLGLVLRTQGRLAEAINHYGEAIRLRPDWSSALTGLAWVLATSPDAFERQPAEAVRLAERALAVTKPPTAAIFDTLGAAYAAANRFEQAIAMAREAVALATVDSPERPIEEIRARLELYERGQPFRLTPQTNTR